jgi:hypothetical protein
VDNKVNKRSNLDISNTTFTLICQCLFSLSSCFVYFMLRCHLVDKTASAGFSPIGGQPPKWPPSGHSKSKYSENTPIHYLRLF